MAGAHWIPKIGQFGLVLVALLFMWAVAFFVSITVYFVIADRYGSSDDLVAYQVLFGVLYATPIVLARTGAFLLGWGERQRAATLAAVAIMVLLSLGFLPMASSWNQCAVGTAFPLGGSDCGR